LLYDSMVPWALVATVPSSAGFFVIEVFTGRNWLREPWA